MTTREVLTTLFYQNWQTCWPFYWFMKFKCLEIIELSDPGDAFYLYHSMYVESTSIIFPEPLGF